MIEGMKFTPEEENKETTWEGQRLMEDKVAEFMEAFKKEHGRRPLFEEEEKVVKGVKALLQIDLNNSETDAEKELLEQAILRADSDLNLIDSRRTFVERNRRRN